MKKTGAIIVAGGTGSRMGSDVPKQFIKLNGKDILLHTIETFSSCDIIDKIIIVCHKDYIKYCNELIKGLDFDITVICGGKTRQASVHNGLVELKDCKYVLIHDAVRCLACKDDILNLYNELLNTGSCTLAVRVKDTIKMTDDNNFVTKTLNRQNLWQIQTPQAFETEEIKKAHLYALETNYLGTDDCSLIEHMGKSVKLVEGKYENIKITTPTDIEIAKVFMKGSE